MSALSVWHNGNDWVVASDAEDALDVWAEHVGEDVEDYATDDWESVPADRVITVVDDEGNNREAKTCAEWAAGGRRYLFGLDHLARRLGA